MEEEWLGKEVEAGHDKGSPTVANKIAGELTPCEPFLDPLLKKNYTDINTVTLTHVHKRAVLT